VSQELSVRVDSASFNRLMRAFRGFDKKLYAATRKRIRDAGQQVVADVQAKVREGGPSRSGLREGLAAGTRVSIGLGKRAGVTVVTNPPAGKPSMAHAWDAGTFRHPVFGNRSVFVSQTGNEFFFATILAHRVEFQRAVLAALQEAIRAVEAAA
jgi:hypothetical protein